MKKSPGFTLIELLVVIGIMMILAALLFPAFKPMLSRARQTQCASNLKQIGVAIAMYKADFKAFPIGFTGGSSVAPPTYKAGEWTLFLNRYLGGDDLDWTMGDAMSRRSKVIQCPAAKPFTNRVFCAYSAHPAVLVDPAWNNWMFPTNGVNPAVLKRPMDTVVIMDGTRGNYGTPATDADATFINVVEATIPSWSGNPADAEKPLPEDFAAHQVEGISGNDHWPSFRHDGKSNTLRADGHVEPVEIGTFLEKHVRLNY